MANGWIATYTDGRTIQEDEMEWQSLPKQGISRLSLRVNDREYHIDGPQQGWIQFKSAYIDMGGEHQISSRVIGYYDGPNKIYYRVDEFTGELKIERV